jgi:hypothetical protein
VIVFDPTGNDEVVNVAVALESRVAVPSTVVPSWNVIVPVGSVPVYETPALSVTLTPWTAGFGEANNRTTG